MVAFGAITKQSNKSFFGNQRAFKVKAFGRLKERSNDLFEIPQINPSEHPLLENGEIYLKASYSDPDAVKQMLSLGYTKDKALSSIETNVWVKNGRALILHRGSSGIKDFVVSDVLLGLNLSGIDPRVFSAKKITEDAQSKYSPIAYHVGHSLGGHLAEICADPLAYVLTYNKGASPYTVFKNISPRQVDIRASGDLVSWFSKFQNTNTITVQNKGKGFLDAHALDNLD